MSGLFKLLLAGGVLVTLPFVVPTPEGLAAASKRPADLAGSLGSPAGSLQDPRRQGQDFRAEVRWNFALLSYRARSGAKNVELAARNLTKVVVIRGDDGRVFLELIHKNQDYSFVEVSEFHLIRQSATFNATDVPVLRTTMDDMGFPDFK